VLVGVLVLQAGQWYAERKEADEVREFEEKVSEKKKEVEAKTKGGHVTRSASKKRL
jgi:hypothetical protein